MLNRFDTAHKHILQVYGSIVLFYLFNLYCHLNVWQPQNSILCYTTEIYHHKRHISSSTIQAQLFDTNAFSANTFSLNVLRSFTATYSQSIVNTNNFYIYFYQRKQISRNWHRLYYDQTNSLGVIRQRFVANKSVWTKYIDSEYSSINTVKNNGWFKVLLKGLFTNFEKLNFFVAQQKKHFL